MLRTLAFALMLAAPSLAAAQQFPDSPIGQEVRGPDGTIVGRVTAVERDSEGRIVAVEIPGLEPGDAPADAYDLVAENEFEGLMPARDDRAAQQRSGAGGDLQRLR